MASECEFDPAALLRMRREGVQAAKRRLARADAEVRRLRGRIDRLWSALADHDAAAREALGGGGGAELALHSRCAEELRGAVSKQHGRLAAARTAVVLRRRELAGAAAELEVLRRLDEKQTLQRRKKVLSAETRQLDADHATQRRRRGTVATGMAERK